MIDRGRWKRRRVNMANGNFGETWTVQSHSQSKRLRIKQKMKTVCSAPTAEGYGVAFKFKVSNTQNSIGPAILFLLLDSTTCSPQILYFPLVFSHFPMTSSFFSFSCYSLRLALRTSILRYAAAILAFRMVFLLFQVI